jgi:ASC-1-like (ASCH) protein/ribosomal protein S18 acetylase RimI-like enzyme
MRIDCSFCREYPALEKHSYEGRVSVETAYSEMNIRPAEDRDLATVEALMEQELSPYYGGDHVAHARRIFGAHKAGTDSVGFFSQEQRMFVLEVNGTFGGLLHLVSKRQETCKISPLIVAPEFRGRHGVGSKLLEVAEQFALETGARQLYCTVAEENRSALQFFQKHGFTVAGRSKDHYKPGITEVMMYKRLGKANSDGPNISVVPYSDEYETDMRRLILEEFPRHYPGVDDSFVDRLLAGYRRRDTEDINEKYKIMNIAINRADELLGLSAATPKKGEPIKVVPLLARGAYAFNALLIDIPYQLKRFGRKLYTLTAPTAEEVMAFQERGWVLEGTLPDAYGRGHVIQQWSLNITGEDFMRSMRVKQFYLDLIKSGAKTLEVRVGYDNIKTIQPGEKIKLASRGEEILIRVNDVRKYVTFAEMLEVEPAEKIAPGNSKTELLNVLKEIYPSSREKLGVVVLDIAVIDDRT